MNFYTYATGNVLLLLAEGIGDGWTWQRGARCRPAVARCESRPRGRAGTARDGNQSAIAGGGGCLAGSCTQGADGSGLRCAWPGVAVRWGRGVGALEQACGEVTVAGDEEAKDASHPWRAHWKTEENEGDGGQR